MIEKCCNQACNMLLPLVLPVAAASTCKALSIELKFNIFALFDRSQSSFFYDGFSFAANNTGGRYPERQRHL